MELRRSRVAAAALVLLVLVALAGLALGAVFATSETAVDSSVVTAQTGTVAPPGDDLALLVRGDSRFAAGVTDRLSARLVDDGYDVTPLDSLAEAPASQVLVVDVVRADIHRGVLTRRATLTVETYYTNRLTENYAVRWSENASGVPARAIAGESGEAVVEGEFRIDDRTRGLPGRYRAQLTDRVVDAVAETFRGAIGQ